jgi:DNA-binding response OmpR family regulator
VDQLGNLRGTALSASTQAVRPHTEALPLTVSLLGPQVIVRNGNVLPAPAPQQRRVLALLATHPGEVVAREDIH